MNPIPYFALGMFVGLCLAGDFDIETQKQAQMDVANYHKVMHDTRIKGHRGDSELARQYISSKWGKHE